MKFLALFGAVCLIAGARAAAIQTDDQVIAEALKILKKETGLDQVPKLEGDLASASDFDQWMKKYEKSYSTDVEKTSRFFNFKVNSYIAAVLQFYEEGSATYAATQFADLTHEEFKLRYRNANFDLVPREKAQIPNIKADATVDWRTKGAVTGVKNQGQCGSCWAFSTTGNIEGQWFLKKNQLISLSEQELVDCDKVDEGCNGGLMSTAYQQIEKLGGLVTEKDYPYTGKDGTCSMDKSQIAVYINSSVTIESDETKMATWCSANGPIAIGINAFAMEYYTGGISKPKKIFCNPKSLDHGVLIVGYGTEGSEPYWIIKNSWGTSWGEDGYYRCYRGSDVCGLTGTPSSSVVN